MAPCIGPLASLLHPGIVLSKSSEAEQLAEDHGRERTVIGLDQQDAAARRNDALGLCEEARAGRGSGESSSGRTACAPSRRPDPGAGRRARGRFPGPGATSVARTSGKVRAIGATPAPSSTRRPGRVAERLAVKRHQQLVALREHAGQHRLACEYLRVDAQAIDAVDVELLRPRAARGGAGACSAGPRAPDPPRGRSPGDQLDPVQRTPAQLSSPATGATSEQSLGGLWGCSAIAASVVSSLLALPGVRLGVG